MNEQKFRYSIYVYEEFSKEEILAQINVNKSTALFSMARQVLTFYDGCRYEIVDNELSKTISGGIFTGKSLVLLKELLGMNNRREIYGGKN
jgi:hypothetical protein